MDLQSISNLSKVEKLNSQSQNRLVQEFPKEEDRLHSLPDITKKDLSMVNVATGNGTQSKLYVFSYCSPHPLYYL